MRSLSAVLPFVKGYKMDTSFITTLGDTTHVSAVMFLQALIVGVRDLGHAPTTDTVVAAPALSGRLPHI